MTRLFRDFLARRPAALDFFPGDWGDPAAWQEAARRTRAQAGPRAEVARVLTERNARWLTDAGRRRLEAVAAGEGVAVVAGQQAGVLGGPLYTLHKALALLRLADWAESQLEVPVLPLFWVAANDSDLVEAGSASVVDRTHTLRDFSLHTHPAVAPLEGRSVGRIPLGEAAAALNGWLADVLHETEFRARLLADVAAAYTPEATVAGAFEELLGGWLGPRGLVLLDPLWPGLEGPSAALFASVLADPLGAGEVIAATSEPLRRAGYHRQLGLPEGRLPLFVSGDGGGRRPLRVGPGRDRFEVEGEGVVNGEELLDSAGPWRLDAGAALRPLLQDYLLPTMAFLGGPSEIAYWAQIGPLYTRLGVAPPVVMPRPRVLLLPRVAARVTEKYGLDPLELADGPEAVVARIARSLFPDDLERAFEGTREDLLAALETLKGQVAAFDPTLAAPFETTAGRLSGELDRLRGKAVANLGRQQETVRAQIAKAAVWLFPRGQPQERVLGVLPFALRYGLDALLDRIVERVDPGRPEREQVVPLD
jgi:bacillithiol biosynthesis cysteine-adding enzyme BshC